VPCPDGCLTGTVPHMAERDEHDKYDATVRLPGRDNPQGGWSTRAGASEGASSGSGQPQTRYPQLGSFGQADEETTATTMPVFSRGTASVPSNSDWASSHDLADSERTMALGGYPPAGYPMDGEETGRDRLVVHVLWEALLCGVVAIASVSLYRLEPEWLTGNALQPLLLSATVLGLLTVGIGLSLRAAVPNLAVGPVAVAAGIFFAEQADRGITLAGSMTFAVVLAVGVVLGVVVVVFHVPAWAASFGALLALVGWLETRDPTITLPDSVVYQPYDHHYYWFGVFVVLSLIGGALGMLPGVRARLGGFRPATDAARRQGAGAGVMAFVALVGSTLLAGLAGVLLVLTVRVATPIDSVSWTGLALGAALVGGTSAFGRRGGLFGTILAVALLVLSQRLTVAMEWSLSRATFGAIAIGLGLLVTRIVESAGRPKRLEETDEAWLGI